MKAFDLQHIGLFDINFETGEQYWSRECRRILRLPETGMPDLWMLLQRVHPDDRAAVLGFAMEPFRGKCPLHRSFEHRLLDPDATVRRVRVEAGAAFSAGSSSDIRRVIGLVIEIGRRKNLELTSEDSRSICNRDAAALPLGSKQTIHTTKTRFLKPRIGRVLRSDLHAHAREA